MSKIARLPISTTRVGLPGLIKWVQATHPQVYHAVASRLAVANQLQGVGILDPSTDPVSAAATSSPGIGAQILDTIKQLIPVAAQTYQQQKLFDLQVKRAQQNLPLYDTSAIADGSAFRVGVDSSTKNTALMIAGLGAAALLLFAVIKR